MVLIPYATTYTTTLTGQAPKFVECEKCRFQFVYIIEHKVSSEGTSMLFLDNAGAIDRSKAGAEDALRRSLEYGCEPVPCPECGWIQEHMIPRARQVHRGWMTKAAIGLSAAAAILAGPAAIYRLSDDSPRWSLATIGIWSVVGILGAAGMTLAVWRVAIHRSFDPNAESTEARKTRGREMATNAAEFLKRFPPAMNER